MTIKTYNICFSIQNEIKLKPITGKERNPNIYILVKNKLINKSQENVTRITYNLDGELMDKSKLNLSSKIF